MGLSRRWYRVDWYERELLLKSRLAMLFLACDITPVNLAYRLFSHNGNLPQRTVSSSGDTDFVIINFDKCDAAIRACRSVRCWKDEVGGPRHSHWQLGDKIRTQNFHCAWRTSSLLHATPYLDTPRAPPKTLKRQNPSNNSRTIERSRLNEYIKSNHCRRYDDQETSA